MASVTMGSVPQESRLLVYRLCCIWGLVIGSWAVLQVTTPLILKDIVGKTDAPIWQGVFTATTAVSGMLGCGITGHYSDRIGRLEFLRPCIVFFFVSTLSVLYSDASRTIYPLWFARFAALSIPSTVVQAFLSDYLSGHALLESFAYIGATFGISMLSSSIVCAIISLYFSRIASLLFGVFLSGLAIIFALNTKPPSGPRSGTSLVAKSDECTEPRSLRGVKGSVRIICSDALLRNLIIALCILRVCNVNTHMMLVLFVDFRLGWELPQLSILAGVAAFSSLLVQLVGVKFLITSNIVLPVLFITLGAVPLVTIGYAFAMTGFQLYLVVLLSSMTTIATTVFNAKIAALASESGVAGLALGCVGTLQNLLEIGASLYLGRLLSWSLTNYSSTNVMSGLPFLVNGAFVTSVVVIVLYSHKRYGVRRAAWEEVSLPM